MQSFCKFYAVTLNLAGSQKQSQFLLPESDFFVKLSKKRKVSTVCQFDGQYRLAITHFSPSPFLWHPRGVMATADSNSFSLSRKIKINEVCLLFHNYMQQPPFLKKMSLLQTLYSVVGKYLGWCCLDQEILKPYYFDYKVFYLVKNFFHIPSLSHSLQAIPIVFSVCVYVC